MVNLVTKNTKTVSCITSKSLAPMFNISYNCEIYSTSELVEVVLSALSVLAMEERGDLVPLWAHLPLIIATPVTAPILVAALPPDVLLDMLLSPVAAPLPPLPPPPPPPPHNSRTSPRTSDNLSGTLTNACKTTVRKPRDESTPTRVSIYRILLFPVVLLSAMRATFDSSEVTSEKMTRQLESNVTHFTTFVPVVCICETFAVTRAH